MSQDAASRLRESPSKGRQSFLPTLDAGKSVELKKVASSPRNAVYGFANAYEKRNAFGLAVKSRVSHQTMGFVAGVLRFKRQRGAGAFREDMPGMRLQIEQMKRKVAIERRRKEELQFELKSISPLLSQKTRDLRLLQSHLQLATEKVECQESIMETTYADLRGISARYNGEVLLDDCRVGLGKYEEAVEKQRRDVLLPCERKREALKVELEKLVDTVRANKERKPERDVEPDRATGSRVAFRPAGDEFEILSAVWRKKAELLDIVKKREKHLNTVREFQAALDNGFIADLNRMKRRVELLEQLKSGNSATCDHLLSLRYPEEVSTAKPHSKVLDDKFPKRLRSKLRRAFPRTIYKRQRKIQMMVETDKAADLAGMILKYISGNLTSPLHVLSRQVAAIARKKTRCVLQLSKYRCRFRPAVAFYKTLLKRQVIDWAGDETALVERIFNLKESEQRLKNTSHHVADEKDWLVTVHHALVGELSNLQKLAAADENDLKYVRNMEESERDQRMITFIYEKAKENAAQLDHLRHGFQSERVSGDVLELDPRKSARYRYHALAHQLKDAIPYRSHTGAKKVECGIDAHSEAFTSATEVYAHTRVLQGGDSPCDILMTVLNEEEIAIRVVSPDFDLPLYTYATRLECNAILKDIPSSTEHWWAAAGEVLANKLEVGAHEYFPLILNLPDCFGAGMWDVNVDPEGSAILSRPLVCSAFRSTWNAQPSVLCEVAAYQAVTGTAFRFYHSPSDWIRWTLLSSDLFRIPPAQQQLTDLIGHAATECNDLQLPPDPVEHRVDLIGANHQIMISIEISPSGEIGCAFSPKP